MQARLDDFFQAFESASGDKKNMLGINIDQRLLGMLASSFRRYSGNRTFQQFEESLLHSFAGNITCDRSAVALAGEFIDFIDIDNPSFGAGDVIIGSLKQC